MQCRIDWLSFTIKVSLEEDETEKTVFAKAASELFELYPFFFDALGTLEGWTWRSGRKPYRASLCRPDGGVAIFVHPNLNHVLIEISGKGCETLSESEHAAAMLEHIAPRLTRIDLACDMMTDTKPTEFVELRETGRFKAHSEVVSESGETCYVGSRTSNRYARVYRYNPPHERAHLLRCEYVLKADDAKIAARSMLEHGQYAVARSLGQQFGWQHKDWSVDTPTEIELRAYRPERREGKTLFWLADTIAPLIVRLDQEGIIDAETWFRTNVLSVLKKG